MSYGRDRTVVPATIPNGGTTSDDVNIGSLRLVGIAMPAAWSAGNLTLQAVIGQPSSNPPAPVWGNVVDGAGAPVVLAATPTAGTFYALPATLQMWGLGRVRLVAGAAQGAARVVGLVCVDG
jgi:hypothetical protein